MSKSKIVYRIKISVFISILVLFFVVGPLSIFITDRYGNSQIVTVSFYKTIIGAKGVSNYIASGGYYYAKGKQYRALTGERLAIGTKFEIKYIPILPSQYDVIRVLPE